MNPYPVRFLELLDTTTGPVLDCGSGGRRHDRIVSLEPVDHPNNTVRGSGLDLPFPADTFELVLSQAVVEHVPEPQRYVDEIVRVLRPGGLLWIEAAFMQPIHQAPEHYFNCTPFGLAHLCRRLETVDQGAFGLFAEWWDWIAREIGAAGIVDEYESRFVRGVFEQIDEGCEPHHRVAAASAVSLLGRKPIA